MRSRQGLHSWWLQYFSWQLWKLSPVTLRNPNNISLLAVWKVAAALPRDSTCPMLINAFPLERTGKSCRRCCFSLWRWCTATWSVESSTQPAGWDPTYVQLRGCLVAEPAPPSRAAPPVAPVPPAAHPLPPSACPPAVMAVPWDLWHALDKAVFLGGQ